jgi:hypothetical protein
LPKSGEVGLERCIGRGGGGGTPLVNCSDVPITLGAWIDANMCRNATPRFLVTHLKGYFERLGDTSSFTLYRKFIIQSETRGKQMLLPNNLDKGLIIFVESD